MILYYEPIVWYLEIPINSIVHCYIKILQMNALLRCAMLLTVLGIPLSFASCHRRPLRPTGVNFHTETLKRVDDRGDNWCITWTHEGDQVTSMCDGNWLNGKQHYHNHLYRIVGEAQDFTRKDIPGYPQFTYDLTGWFGYGVISIGNNLYSMVSKTPGENWSGPFRGIKMLKSPDAGKSWYRVNSLGEERFLDPWDNTARDDTSRTEMFFMEESGRFKHDAPAYPFSFCSFVQNGQANSAAKDDYVYIYSPEGAQSNQLLLARVKQHEIEKRDHWEYFTAWNGTDPVWTDSLDKRAVIHEFPEKNNSGEYFGWYSWLPSVVWNEGLGLYIMVNGGTYAGHWLTDSGNDYYDNWMHTKTGSLGFWYAEKPYGPWNQFFYTDYWIIDDVNNRTYQPKLSPKWISADGKNMVLIWSDAMKNEAGKSHAVNYRWNQMEITLELKQ